MGRTAVDDNWTAKPERAMNKTMVSVEDAVRRVLWHDVTRIVPGRSKGFAYRRGHVIRTKEVRPLLDSGILHVG